MSDYAIRMIEEGRDLGGDYPRTLDDKGRLVFPVEFREAFADGLWVMVGKDRCLEAWTAEGHKHNKLEIVRKPVTSRSVRLQRSLIMAAREVELDSQHRVTLPHELRDEVGLDREILVKGNVDHVQIWDRSTYRAFLRQAGEHAAALDEQP